MSTARLGLVVVQAAAAAACWGGDALPIRVEGDFSDWGTLAPVATDPVGDIAAGNIDFGRLWIANDNFRFFIRFEVGRETILQNTAAEPAGSGMILYIDGDGNSATGLSTQGIGAELAINFGAKSTTYYSPAGAGTAMPFGFRARIQTGPTHSASEFEIGQNFAVYPGGVPTLFTNGGEIRLVMVDPVGGDRLPDSGFVTYTPDLSAVPAATPIPLERESPAHIRIVAHNVLNSSPDSVPAVYDRLLSAVDPDIICWSEMYTGTAMTNRLLIESFLPPPGGGQWYAAKVADCVTISKFPIVASAASDGNLVVRIDLPGTLTDRDLVVFNAHTPCCSSNAGRDAEHDRMASIWRNLITGSGPFPSASNDCVVMCGDFNMVGFVRQLHSLRDGDILDNATFGPDFAPARAMGSLTAVGLRHTDELFAYTWENPSGSFAPGRLDWMFVSEDAATVRRHYILNTGTMPLDRLAAEGLNPGDSSAASDHGMLVVDLEFPPPTSGVSDWRLR